MSPTKFSHLVAALACALPLCSCVDNDYDLSDIDTTVEITVTDLVLPINIDEITLEAILDLSNESRIQNVDGQYAFIDDGTFESSPVHVPTYTATTDGIEPITAQMALQLSSLYSAAPASGSVKSTDETPVFTCDLPIDSTTVEIKAYNVDEAIVAVSRLGIEQTEMELSLSFTGLDEVADEVCVEDLTLQFLKGLEATVSPGTYNSETGIITIESVTTSGHSITVDITASAVTDDSGMTIDDDHTFSLAQTCRVNSGQLVAYKSSLLSSFFNSDGSVNTSLLIEKLPQSVDFTCDFTIGDIVAETFSGTIKYEIDGIDIDAVTINDLPSVLSQSGTDILLLNPQIYLQFNNPVNSYGAYATAGLTITPTTNGSSTDYELDDDLVIDEADNKFCLSPTDPQSYYSGTIDSDDGTSQAVDFAGCEHQTFSSLGDILSGDRLPEKIGITVTDPIIPTQTVQNFPLGTDLDPVDGVYVFFAPLHLTADATISYTDTIDGWNDEDVDAITISKLVVDADISSDMPINLDIKAYPIDTDGNKITDGGVTVVGSTSATVAYGIDEAIQIAISGTVTHLDGVIITVYATGTDQTDDALQPDQTITLKNIKATVSGSYQKEL